MGCVMASGTAGRICGESPTWHLGIQHLLAGAEFPLLSSLIFLAGLQMAQPSTELLGIQGSSALVGTGCGKKDLGKE